MTGEGTSASLTARRRLLFTVLALVAAGLAWRLLCSGVILPRWEHAAEAASYPDLYPYLAEELLRSGELGYGSHGATPTTARGPGFPVWLALGILIGGSGPAWLGFWSGVPAVLAGSFLAGALLRRYGPAAGGIGYAVVVLHPLPSLLTSRVMGDEFYAACGFFAAVAWLGALRGHGRRSIVLTLLAALLLGAHTLTRSSGLITLAVLLLAGSGLTRLAPRPGLTLLLAVLTLLPVAAWSLRSSRLEHRPVLVQSLTWYNFWVGEGFDRFGQGWIEPDAWGKTLDLIRSRGALLDDEAVPFHYAGLTPIQTASMERALGKAALRRIVDDPAGYALRVVRGIPRFWIQAQSRTRTVQYAMGVLPVILLAGAGLFTTIANRTAAAHCVAVSALIIAAHNLACAAILPMARMSIEIYPYLGYLAAIGAVSCIGLLRGIRAEEADRDRRDAASAGTSLPG